MTTASTKLFGLLGHPVAHSRSPAMFSAAFAHVGRDAAYLAFDVRPEDLERAVRGLAALGASGFNVTTPHKAAIVPLLDAVEEEARAIGAVNAVAREDGAWVGVNTDADGLVAALDAEGVILTGARVVVLGAGGAAAACVAACRKGGASSVHVAARRMDIAWGEHAKRAPGAEVTFGEIAQVRSAFARADLVLQATTATLSADAHGFVGALPWDALPSSSHVMDLAYGGSTHVLRTRCVERALGYSDGRAMLAFQAAFAWKRWLGTDAPVDVMRRAINYLDAPFDAARSPR